MTFIANRVRNAIVMHGYTTDNKEIIEEIKDEVFIEKLVAIDRIQSISEKYMLVLSSHGRVMYWEYEDDFESIKARLNRAGLVIT